jgi:RimJ/RimL family protein N-acetyltransferase
MQVTLERWGRDDLVVLQRSNTPEMTRFLGGVEGDDALAQRHADYLAQWDSGEVRMFRVTVGGTIAGYAGWWEEEHDGAPVYEIGCVIEPQWQGQGVASAAHVIVGYANAQNAASNALCARVGFTLVGTGAFPVGDGTEPMPVNVWIIDRRVPA